MGDIGSITMITDRTQADVDYVKRLNALGWRNISPDERTEYIAGLKGAYNASDLNRVEFAAETIADILRGYGYHTDLTIKTGWTSDEAVVDVEAGRYLGNVRALLKYVSVLSLTPGLPDTMDNFTFAQANAIEEVLLNIYGYLNNMIAAFRYSGTFYSGEEGYRWAQA